MARQTKKVKRLIEEYNKFQDAQPRSNPDETVDEIDDMEEFFEHLEASGIDIGNPTDSEWAAFLTAADITDESTQTTIVEMAAEWHLADADGAPADAF